ncbi:hypothetical protein BN2475_580037 [Paraburkholderia ribeironis]|uniref:Uncharacterized protein n=1 Tax=Paraburkholderia ribeironis TaxID=1247936 RepID=A0A1N7SEA7_9BURK|nr:hypothetical protein BN2475_580037 [Paraburkholderia ribeironis]
MVQSDVADAILEVMDSGINELNINGEEYRFMRFFTEVGNQDAGCSRPSRLVPTSRCFPAWHPTTAFERCGASRARFRSRYRRQMVALARMETCLRKPHPEEPIS